MDTALPILVVNEHLAKRLGVSSPIHSHFRLFNTLRWWPMSGCMQGEVN